MCRMLRMITAAQCAQIDPGTLLAPSRPRLNHCYPSVGFSVRMSIPSLIVSGPHLSA
jgi:hypothetical protein